MSDENIFNAATVMFKAGDEIEAMFEKLYSLLIKKLESLKEVRKVDLQNDSWDEENEWVYTSCVRNYGIYKKGARQPSAHLAIQIKLCDQEEAEIVGRRPLCYVLFCAGAEWDRDEFLVHSSLNEGFVLEDECLWQRYTDDEDPTQPRFWTDAEFSYVIPLLALNTPKDLQTLIVEPIYTLISKGLDPKNLDKRILRFEVKNDAEIQLLS